MWRVRGYFAMVSKIGSPSSLKHYTVSARLSMGSDHVVATWSQIRLEPVLFAGLPRLQRVGEVRQGAMVQIFEALSVVS